MRRPSFQFYPADWLGNTNLRRCSHAEKGAWVDVMCLMHDSEEYGVLRWPLKEIAAAASCRLGDLKGLISKGVLKGSDQRLPDPFIYVPRSGRRDGAPVVLIPAQVGQIWFSSRMVRDEYVRQHRGSGTRFGDADGADDAQDNLSPKQSPKAAPMPPFGDGSSSSASASASQGEADKPPSPSKSVTFSTWMENIKAAGERAITDHQALWDYVQRIRLPAEFVELAWLQFKRRYLQDPQYRNKRYKDWRQVFRNAIEGNWFKLWMAADDGYRLTTQGVQAQRELEAVEVPA